MKKLSEIGTRVTPTPESITQFEPYTSFTDGERRELVREVFFEAYERGNGYPPSEWDLEKYLKEQEL